MLTPQYLFADITRITPQFLRQKGITALLLDVDNTLTAHGSQQLSQGVEAWLETMKQNGIRLMIVSNNTEQRVAPFADRIGVGHISMGCKPLPLGLARARRQLGVQRRQLALVGDQLFTDRLAGWNYGIPVLVVQPLAPDTHRGIRFKRHLEQPFIRRYFKKGGQLL